MAAGARREPPHRAPEWSGRSRAPMRASAGVAGWDRRGKLEAGWHGSRAWKRLAVVPERQDTGPFYGRYHELAARRAAEIVYGRRNGLGASPSGRGRARARGCKIAGLFEKHVLRRTRGGRWRVNETVVTGQTPKMPARRAIRTIAAITIAILLLAPRARAAEDAGAVDASAEDSVVSIPQRDVSDLFRAVLHRSLPTEVETQPRPGLS